MTAQFAHRLMIGSKLTADQLPFGENFISLWGIAHFPLVQFTLRHDREKMTVQRSLT
jgi:hypothetical protein